MQHQRGLGRGLQESSELFEGTPFGHTQRRSFKESRERRGNSRLLSHVGISNTRLHFEQGGVGITSFDLREP